ncbi:hypothetical protein FXN61_07645 [Lentzea sp. PSKA42]|uniref:Secreted protein n=1 Tax=Lentzea indica TaxID=2604800 RepID=A0ABX1FDJ4_9PSEU|nr:hypothetical protein [Lentzea indica]NKE56713.1 hypothetical protein [Lentzea indica]
MSSRPVTPATALTTCGSASAGLIRFTVSATLRNATWTGPLPGAFSQASQRRSSSSGSATSPGAMYSTRSRSFLGFRGLQMTQAGTCPCSADQSCASMAVSCAQAPFAWAASTATRWARSS